MRHQVELALHDELEQRLGRHQPQVQADADLAQIFLVDRQPRLRAFVAVEQLERERLAVLDEPALARRACFQPASASSCERRLRVVLHSSGCSGFS